jgi:hypothetical protein
MISIERGTLEHTNNVGTWNVENKTYFIIETNLWAKEHEKEKKKKKKDATISTARLSPYNPSPNINPVLI